jgi:hypothetical protein
LQLIKLRADSILRRVNEGQSAVPTALRTELFEVHWSVGLQMSNKESKTAPPSSRSEGSLFDCNRVTLQMACAWGTFSFVANSRSSLPRSSSESHSPRTHPHFGQSIRYTIAPFARAPKLKFGGTLHVEQTKTSVPFRAFIPDR